MLNTAVKLACCAAIIICCGIAGLEYAKKFTRREIVLGKFIAFISRIEQEVAYAYSPITKIMEEMKFSDSYPEEICEFLKEKKSVIVNLEYVNKDVARRIVDFISGGVHALDGHIQKVSNAIFLVAPVNYEIASDLAREEIKNKLSVSWLKNNN